MVRSSISLLQFTRPNEQPVPNRICVAGDLKRLDFASLGRGVLAGRSEKRAAGRAAVDLAGTEKVFRARAQGDLVIARQRLTCRPKGTWQRTFVTGRAGCARPHGIGFLRVSSRRTSGLSAPPPQNRYVVGRFQPGWGVLPSTGSSRKIQGAWRGASYNDAPAYVRSSKKKKRELVPAGFGQAKRRSPVRLATWWALAVSQKNLDR